MRQPGIAPVLRNTRTGEKEDVSNKQDLNMFKIEWDTRVFRNWTILGQFIKITKSRQIFQIGICILCLRLVFKTLGTIRFIKVKVGGGFIFFKFNSLEGNSEMLPPMQNWLPYSFLISLFSYLINTNLLLICLDWTGLNIPLDGRKLKWLSKLFSVKNSQILKCNFKIIQIAQHLRDSFTHKQIFRSNVIGQCS